MSLPHTTYHYLVRVLRCRHNEQIIAFNGDGKDYLGHLQQHSKKSARIVIERCLANHKESPLHTILLQGLSKGERMDMAIQKAVELGINEIYPLQTAFSALKLTPDRREKKYQHWQAIMHSACEQCGRAVVPVLHPVKTIAAVLPHIEAEEKMVFHPYPKIDNKPQFLSLLTPDQTVGRVAVLIGAEGGLSDKEINLAEQHGFIRLQLGQRILRTETATVSAITLLQFLWGDYGKS